ncbi:T9SS type A sorting domain-containing protein [Hymenobacter rigui]|nr:T9SS type A sorting domain-containing protein [Hymenobacter rigui]
MLNSFSLVTAADTVPWFAARAFRYRGLYYLVTPGRDSVSSWVHAARITTRRVQGLGTDYSQMQDLSAAVKDGQFAELVRFRNFSADSVVLRFDKAALHRFYRTLPDSFPTYRVVPGRAAVSAPTAARKQPVNHSFTVYPNPATEAATVQFTQPAPRTIQVLDEAGREILVVPSSETVVNLPLSNVKAGSYLVRVAAGQALPQSSRRLLVVK